MIDAFKIDLYCSYVRPLSNWIQNTTTHCKLGIVRKEIFRISKIVDEEREYLYITLRPDSDLVSIKGNLRNWMYGSVNAVRDLTYNDFIIALEQISKKTGIALIDIYTAKIKRIEIGGNIKLQRKYEGIIPSIYHYPNRKRIAYGDETTKFVGVKWDLIYYDSLKKRARNYSEKVRKKLLKNLMCLRFEIKIKAISGVDPKLGAMIKSFRDFRNNWDDIIDYWENSFKKGEFVDTFSSMVYLEDESTDYKKLRNLYAFIAIKTYGLDNAFRYVAKKSKKGKRTHARKQFKAIYDEFIGDDNKSIYTHVSSLVAKKAKRQKRRNGSLTSI